MISFRKLLGLYSPARVVTRTLRGLQESKSDCIMALSGVKVVEIAGLAPSPLCGMILADFGADVIRVDKTSAYPAMQADTMCRGKKSIAVDMKKEKGINVLKSMCSRADVLLEPFRKGVMEKLGLGPGVLMKENPRLIYARMTGYGQHGPWSDRAGHDTNYIAISGLLSMLGRKGEKPYPPVNLMGDFAGGGVICALGVLLALLERNRSGQGQVIDANMVEGANYVGSFLWTSRKLTMWGKERGEGWLDTGAPWYDTYETADGKFMSVGAIEPQFYAKLIEGLGLSADEAPQFGDMPTLKNKMTEVFASKTQEEWCKVFDHVDACVAPVIPWNEAHTYPHNAERHSFSQDLDGYVFPNPAPRLSRTPGRAEPSTLLSAGQHTTEVLHQMGHNQEEINELIMTGAVEQHSSGASKL